MIFYREQLAESICHESGAAHKVVEKYVHWILYVELFLHPKYLQNAVWKKVAWNLCINSLLKTSPYVHVDVYGKDWCLNSSPKLFCACIFYCPVRL